MSSTVSLRLRHFTRGGNNYNYFYGRCGAPHPSKQWVVKLFQQQRHVSAAGAAASCLLVSHSSTLSSSARQYQWQQRCGYQQSRRCWRTKAAVAAHAIAAPVLLAFCLLEMGPLGGDPTISTSTTMTKCEALAPEEETAPASTTGIGGSDNNNSNSNSKDQEENEYVIGPDDPFYTIPEEDEPTDCSMCNTFRQGPCRLHWKRFELCVKKVSDDGKQEETKEESDSTNSPTNDPSSSSSNPPSADSTTEKKDDKNKKERDSTACMKYAMPFYYCSSKFVNTYLIIGNEQTQDTVLKPLMDVYESDEAQQSRRLCYAKQPQVHWKNWETFVETLIGIGGKVPTRFALKKTGFQTPAEALRATWEDPNGNQYLMMNDEGEPYLITVTAEIPKRIIESATTNNDESTDVTLFMTFALDQDGNLVGDTRYDEEDDLKQQKDGDNDNNKKQPSDVIPLHIQLLPGSTESFVIYSLYVPKNGDFLEEGLLYESKTYSLEAISKKATSNAKQLARQKLKQAEASEMQQHRT